MNIPVGKKYETEKFFSEAIRFLLKVFLTPVPKLSRGKIRDLEQGRRLNGGENVGKKMNLLSFKLNRVYLDPLNMLNTGDVSWS